MSFTVREVISNVRYRHRSFDETSQPDEACLALINQFVRRARLAIMQRDARHMLLQATVDLPLADFPSGHPLPAADLIADVIAVTIDVPGQTAGDTVAIIAAALRQDMTEWPAVYLANDRIYLKGEENDWTIYDKLLVNYVPTFVNHTSLDEDVALPDFAQAALEAWLAMTLAGRAGVVEKRGTVSMYQLFADEASEAWNTMILHATVQRSKESWHIRERF